MGELQCPQCLAVYPTLDLLTSHMEHDDNISAEWVTQWVSIFANQKPQPKSPSSSPSKASIYTDTTEIDPAVARFRVWFVLDRATIHRREIPGNEKFEGFCSQLESLFYLSGSEFDVCQFEYVLVAKKREQEMSAKPFTGLQSYHRMRSKLLEDKSPWRHAIVRRIVTSLSALESFARIRPMFNADSPPVRNIPIARPRQDHPQQLQALINATQPYFRWMPENSHGLSHPSQGAMVPPPQPIRWDQPLQVVEASPLNSSLPVRTAVHTSTGPADHSGRLAAASQSLSIVQSSPLKLPSLKWIRPEGPVRHLSQSPKVSKRPKYSAKRPSHEADGQILLSPISGPSSSMLLSPLVQSTESPGHKRRRVARSGTARGHEPLPSSPLARPKALATIPAAEAAPTMTPPIDFVDQLTGWGTATVQMQQPTQQKRKFIDLRVSNDDEDQDGVQAGGPSFGKDLKRKRGRPRKADDN